AAAHRRTVFAAAPRRIPIADPVGNGEAPARAPGSGRRRTVAYSADFRDAAPVDRRMAGVHAQLLRARPRAAAESRCGAAAYGRSRSAGARRPTQLLARRHDGGGRRLPRSGRDPALTSMRAGQTMRRALALLVTALCAGVLALAA